MRQWDSCLVAVVWDIPSCFLNMYQLHSVWVAIDDLVTNDRACIWCILVNVVFFDTQLRDRENELSLAPSQRQPELPLIKLSFKNAVPSLIAPMQWLIAQASNGASSRHVVFFLNFSHPF